MLRAAPCFGYRRHSHGQRDNWDHSATGSADPESAHWP